MMQSMMLPKIVIVVLLLAIVATLFSGLFFMMKDNSQKRRMLTALKIRVALSITLVAFLVLAYYMGWIAPHGLRP